MHNSVDAQAMHVSRAIKTIPPPPSQHPLLVTHWSLHLRHRHPSIMMARWLTGTWTRLYYLSLTCMLFGIWPYLWFIAQCSMKGGRRGEGAPVLREIQVLMGVEKNLWTEVDEMNDYNMPASARLAQASLHHASVWCPSNLRLTMLQSLHCCGVTLHDHWRHAYYRIMWL